MNGYISPLTELDVTVTLGLLFAVPLGALFTALRFTNRGDKEKPVNGTAAKITMEERTAKSWN